MKMTLPEIQIIEETDTELEPLFQVIIHNDHITPMDFVVYVLKSHFHLANNKAADIMFTAHIQGSAYVQSLAKSEAEKRISRAHLDAHNAGYPLKFTMEPE
jgi:ATP-dependent Clp protease adaptor protein ClpS